MNSSTHNPFITQKTMDSRAVKSVRSTNPFDIDEDL